MPEMTRTVGTIYPWVNLVCFFVAGCFIFFGYLFGGTTGVGTVWALMGINGAVLAGLYRWTEGTSPRGKSRTLEQFGVITFDVGLFFLALSALEEYAPASYFSLGTIIFSVLLFIPHWFLSDPLANARPSETPSSKVT